eukprot:303692_1
MASSRRCRIIFCFTISLIFYAITNVYVLEQFNKSIEQTQDIALNTNDVPSDTITDVTTTPVVDIKQHCAPITTIHTFSSCAITLHSTAFIMSILTGGIGKLCQNVHISPSEFVRFERFMTVNPWFHFRITCLLPSKDVLVSLYIRYNDATVIKFYEYLRYIQYTASHVTHHGVNEQVWIDPQIKCLFRYYGSTLMIFHAELEHAFSHMPAQRYNPVIPCWIHVDTSWCNATNHWHCYFLPPFDDILFKKDPKWVNVEMLNVFLKEWRDKYSLVDRRMQLVSFLTRPTVQFESILYELSESLQHWKFDEEKCVALHLRYGDKVTECDNDMGNCHFKIGVKEYLEQTLIIVNKTQANIVFIMTDDVNKCIETNDTRLVPREDYEHLRFYCIGGQGQLLEGWYDEHKVKEGKDATVEFGLMILSLRWAQHCLGFVGNFDSNIASLAYMYMCDYHDGNCPYHYSFDALHRDHPVLSWG